MKRAGFINSLASNGLEAIDALEKSESEGFGESSSQKFDVILVSVLLYTFIFVLTELS
jgi:hypothetical protein